MKGKFTEVANTAKRRWNLVFWIRIAPFFIVLPAYYLSTIPYFPISETPAVKEYLKERNQEELTIEELETLGIALKKLEYNHTQNRVVV